MHSEIWIELHGSKSTTTVEVLACHSGDSKSINQQMSFLNKTSDTTQRRSRKYLSVKVKRAVFQKYQKQASLCRL